MIKKVSKHYFFGILPVFIVRKPENYVLVSETNLLVYASENRKMDGFELILWRKEHKMTQQALAAAFGVSVRTISNWEAGRHRLPLGYSARLERIAWTTNPKPVDTPPDWVSGPVKDERSDLDLYQGKVKGSWLLGSEHPTILLGNNHSLRRDGKWPWSVLESPEYLAALKRKRGVRHNG